SHKGVDDLVEAVRALGPGVVLALVGVDPARSGAPRWSAPSHVRVIGEIPFDDVPRYLVAADVVAVPQRATSDTVGQVPAKLLNIARPFVFHGGVERATAGLVGALVDHGYDVHLLSPRGQAPMRGVTLHPLSLPPLPSAARVLALAVSARRAVAGGGWDVVQ